MLDLQAATKVIINQTVKIPAEGITMKIPKYWIVKPLESMTDFEDRRTKKRAVSVRGYWLRQNQHLIQYTQNNVGNLSVARVTYKVPSARSSAEFKDVLDKFFAKESSAISYKDTADLQTWMKTYTQSKDNFTPISLKALGLRSPSGTVLKVYSDTKNYFLLFYVKSRRILIGMNWQFPIELDQKKIKSSLLTFIRNMRFGKPEGKERVTQNSRLQNRDAKNSNGSDKFKASKAKVIGDIKNLPNWYYVETKNYIICSNMPSRYRGLIKKVQVNIEFFRKAYEKLVPPWQPIDDVSVVKIFATREDYLNYVGEKYKWSGGLWSPSKQELLISPPGYDGKKRDAIERMLDVVYHEAFHQYLYYATGKVGNAVWFNEGHAEFIEDAEIKGGKFLKVEENERKANLVRSFIKQKQASIARLIALNHEQFYSESGRDLNYNMGWALTYFLRKHCEPNNNDYAKIFYNYSSSLERSKVFTNASKSSIQGIDMVKLQKDFEEFWLGKSDRRKADSRKIFYTK